MWHSKTHSFIHSVISYLESPMYCMFIDQTGDLLSLNSTSCCTNLQPGAAETNSSTDIDKPDRPTVKIRSVMILRNEYRVKAQNVLIRGVWKWMNQSNNHRIENRQRSKVRSVFIITCRKKSCVFKSNVASSPLAVKSKVSAELRWLWFQHPCSILMCASKTVDTF